MKRTHIIRLALLLSSCLMLFSSCKSDDNWFCGVWFSGDKSLIIEGYERIELNNIESESPYYTKYWRVGDALFVKVGKEQQTLELNPKNKTLLFMGDVYERGDASALKTLYPWIYGTWSHDSMSPSLVISPTNITYYDSNGKVLAKGKYSIKQGEYSTDSELDIKWNHPTDLTVRLEVHQESLFVGSRKGSLSLWRKNTNQESGSQKSTASITSKQSSSSSSSSTQRNNTYSSNSSSQGDYSWIVGSWYVTTPYGTMSIKFEGNGQRGRVTELSDAMNINTAKYGTYEVNGNVLSYRLNGESWGSTEIYIESGHRLSAGGGYYYKKLN